MGSELVCRYSVTDTDSWAVPNGVDEAGLRRGIDFLATASSQGSPYYAQLTLSAGRAIVFDNTKISHGRTQYRDLGERPRCMYRGLSLTTPALTCADPDRSRPGRKDPERMPDVTGLIVGPPSPFDPELAGPLREILRRRPSSIDTGDDPGRPGTDQGAGVSLTSSSPGTDRSPWDGGWCGARPGS